MELKYLNTFLHVAELNSFTRAGAVLGYSQSTVSFQIRQLEEELGFPLFERINRTVVLTEKGREALAYAQQILRMTASLKAGGDGTREIGGRIRLATSDSLCSELLGGDFARFRAAYPAISLQILMAGTGEMFRLIDHNEVDALLTLDSHIYNTEYIIVREEAVRVSFVAPRQHPLAEKPCVTLRELAQEPFILTEKGMSYRRLLDEQLAQRSVEIVPVLEIGSPELICRLLTQQVGLSFLPDFVTEPYVARGELCRLSVPEVQVEVWKQLLHHRDKWRSPQLAAVLDYCAAHEFRAAE